MFVSRLFLFLISTTYTNSYKERENLLRKLTIIVYTILRQKSKNSEDGFFLSKFCYNIFMAEVILVDENDNPIGREEKIKAHEMGKLHRCFSILIFNPKGELLIQQRAKFKYHSSGLWSNTCCSHPRPNEDLKTEAKRRLKEEVGVDCDLKEIFTFIYKAKVGALIEHEFDHVFVGRFNGTPRVNPKEVQDLKWVNLKKLEKDMKEHPRKYTFWFKKILDLYGKQSKKLS